MRRRSFLSSPLTAPLAAGQSARQTPRPPNILFVLFDKCRRDALGAYGGRAVPTPNLDWIAATGVRFDHCYKPQALCGPVRASILTGLYPHAHGPRPNVYPAPSGRVNSNYQEAIVDPFRDPRFRLWSNFVYFLSHAGYATAHIGKWHLGPANPGFYDYFKSFNSLLWHRIGEPHRSDLAEDPMETKNLWREQPEVVPRLAAQLGDWGRRHEDRLAVELASRPVQ